MPPKTTTYVYTKFQTMLILIKKKFHGELEQLYLKMPEIKGRIQKDRQQIVVESVNRTSKNIQKSNMLREPWLTITLIRGTHNS